MKFQTLLAVAFVGLAQGSDDLGIVGGEGNTASGTGSVVVGGQNNGAVQPYSAVAGGNKNKVRGA